MFTLETHSGAVKVALSPDEKILLTGGGNTVKVWNWHNKELLHTIKEPDEAICLAIQCNNKIFVSSHNNNKIDVRDLHTGKRLILLNETPQLIYSLAISPDGQTIISGSSTGKINIWNWQRQELQHTIEGHCQRIESLSFTPDGKKLLVVPKERSKCGDGNFQKYES